MKAQLLYVLPVTLDATWNGTIWVKSPVVPRVGEYVSLFNRNGYVRPFIVVYVRHVHKRWFKWNVFNYVAVQLKEAMLSSDYIYTV